MAEKELFIDQALAVPPIGKDFDPNSIPKDGMEYIQQVTYEARNCDQVVVSNMDVKKFEKKRTPVLLNQHVDVKCHKLLPPSNLQNEWLADFSEVRLTVERRRTVQIHHHQRKYAIPIVEHEEGWHKFCVGDYKRQNGSDKTPVGDETSEKFDKESSTQSDEKTKIVCKRDTSLVYTEPHLYLMASMMQVTIIKLLDYHVDWLQEKKTDFKHSGPWLYALLACLEIPLIPETCSTIRSLARMAAECRSKLTSPDDGILDTLNLLICLVGKYFRQLDLADP